MRSSLTTHAQDGPLTPHAEITADCLASHNMSCSENSILYSLVKNGPAETDLENLRRDRQLTPGGRTSGELQVYL